MESGRGSCGCCSVGAAAAAVFAVLALGGDWCATAVHNGSVSRRKTVRPQKKSLAEYRTRPEEETGNRQDFRDKNKEKK